MANNQKRKKKTYAYAQGSFRKRDSRVDKDNSSYIFFSFLY
jgi:hypothetical protein